MALNVASANRALFGAPAIAAMVVCAAAAFLAGALTDEAGARGAAL